MAFLTAAREAISGNPLQNVEINKIKMFARPGRVRPTFLKELTPHSWCCRRSGPNAAIARCNANVKWKLQVQLQKYASPRAGSGRRPESANQRNYEWKDVMPGLPAGTRAYSRKVPSGRYDLQRMTVQQLRLAQGQATRQRHRSQSQSWSSMQ